MHAFKYRRHHGHCCSIHVISYLIGVFCCHQSRDCFIDETVHSLIPSLLLWTTTLLCHHFEGIGGVYRINSLIWRGSSKWVMSETVRLMALLASTGLMVWFGMLHAEPLNFYRHVELGAIRQTRRTQSGSR